MKQNKLLELLATCDQKERTALYDFVASPYFVKDAAITRLIHYLIAHPEKSFDDKQQLFRIAYPQEDYVDKQYRYLISNCAKLVVQFWQIQAYNTDQSRQLLDRLEILSGRNIEKAFRQAKKRWKDLENRDSNINLNSYWYQLRYQEIVSNHFFKDRVRQLDRNIETLVTAQDRYYYLYRLGYACDMLNKSAILQREYKKPLLPEWFVYLKKEKFFNDLLIESYYWMWQVLNDPEEESHFQPFLNKIRQLIDYAAPDILRMFYNAAINYALRKTRLGKSEYRAIALQLHLEGIDKKILLVNGELSPWTFGNIVKLALREEKYAFAKQFIEEKAKYLPKEALDNAVKYNLAELHYANKDYNDAQKYLLEVKYSDLQYYLGGRILLAKIYYENEEDEPLLSLLNAFSIFLKRNTEVSSGIKQTCLNFCRILQQLVRKNEKRLIMLDEEIANTQLLAEREWLLQQCKIIIRK